MTLMHLIRTLGVIQCLVSNTFEKLLQSCFERVLWPWWQTWTLFPGCISCAVFLWAIELFCLGEVHNGDKMWWHAYFTESNWDISGIDVDVGLMFDSSYKFILVPVWILYHGSTNGCCSLFVCVDESGWSFFCGFGIDASSGHCRYAHFVPKSISCYWGSEVLATYKGS